MSRLRSRALGQSYYPRTPKDTPGHRRTPEYTTGHLYLVFILFHWTIKMPYSAEKYIKYKSTKFGSSIPLILIIVTQYTIFYCTYYDSRTYAPRTFAPQLINLLMDICAPPPWKMQPGHLSPRAYFWCGHLPPSAYFANGRLPPPPPHPRCLFQKGTFATPSPLRMNRITVLEVCCNR